MSAQSPDREHHLGVTPVAFSSFAQFPAVSAVDPRFHGQAEGDLNRLWPGCKLRDRELIPVQRPGTTRLQEHCHGHQTF